MTKWVQVLSRELLNHNFRGFQQIIIRIWGKTILNRHGNITQEINRAFSTRPCFGVRSTVRIGFQVNS